MPKLGSIVKGPSKSMGKQKQKNRKPDEVLLGENRLYKKQLKKLNQEIRRLQKEIAYNQNKNGTHRVIVKDEIEKCPDCGKGELNTLDIGIRKITRCSICDYQKVTK
jgi:hypothetical protein